MSQRRKFLQSLFFMPAIAKSNMGGSSKVQVDSAESNSSLSHRFKISLNAYSFNAPLTKKEITIEEVIDFCGNLRISGGICDLLVNS